MVSLEFVEDGIATTGQEMQIAGLLKAPQFPRHETAYLQHDADAVTDSTSTAPPFRCARRMWHGHRAGKGGPPACSSNSSPTSVAAVAAAKPAPRSVVGGSRINAAIPIARPSDLYLWPLAHPLQKVNGDPPMFPAVGALIVAPHASVCERQEIQSF